jgi:hypothetical protein
MSITNNTEIISKPPTLYNYSNVPNPNIQTVIANPPHIVQQQPQQQQQPYHPSIAVPQNVNSNHMPRHYNNNHHTNRYDKPDGGNNFQFRGRKPMRGGFQKKSFPPRMAARSQNYNNNNNSYTPNPNVELQQRPSHGSIPSNPSISNDQGKISNNSPPQQVLNMPSKKIQKKGKPRQTGKPFNPIPRRNSLPLNESAEEIAPIHENPNPNQYPNPRGFNGPQNPVANNFVGGPNKPVLGSQSFFKTKLCPHMMNGNCTKGETCSYAHDQTEMREAPNLKRTKLCQLFEMGRCHMGGNCAFAHGEGELRSTPDFFKTSICQNFLKGNCSHGSKCRFAHGDKEIRPPTFTSKIPQGVQGGSMRNIPIEEINYGYGYQVAVDPNMMAPQGYQILTPGPQGVNGQTIWYQAQIVEPQPTYYYSTTQPLPQEYIHYNPGYATATLPTYLPQPNTNQKYN